MKDSEGVGCLCVLGICLLAFISYVVCNGLKYDKIYEECQSNGVTSSYNMQICFGRYTFDGHFYLKDFTLKDFTLNEKPIYSDYDKCPYTFKSCTFTNMVIELNPLENVQFIDCTFINTKFNDTLIQNALFLNCIFEESEFSNCIFGKDVKYYDWTISTLKLNGNTYTPEHIDNGVNKFETFVESSME